MYVDDHPHDPKLKQITWVLDFSLKKFTIKSFHFGVKKIIFCDFRIFYCI